MHLVKRVCVTVVHSSSCQRGLKLVPTLHYPTIPIYCWLQELHDLAAPCTFMATGMPTTLSV